MTPSADPVWVSVARLSEFPDDGRLVRSVAGYEILLCRSNSTVLAMHNRCPHLGKPLTRGRLFGGQFTCPFHGACFDLKTGAAIAGPAVRALHLFPVRLEGDEVLIDLNRKPPDMFGGFARV
jgi:nitrite reductase/ring-hydroxylating ferredoxin subunit